MCALKFSDLVKLISEDHVLAIIATDRNSSHLAEQLAVKAFVPLIAISADRTLTSVNIPWVFRLPSEVDAAAKSGPNRAKLREHLASAGAFDLRGEPR